MPLRYSAAALRWESDSDVVTQDEYEARVARAGHDRREKFLAAFPYAISRPDRTLGKRWPHYYRTKDALMAQLAAFRIMDAACTVHKYDGRMWKAKLFTAPHIKDFLESI